MQITQPMKNLNLPQDASQKWRLVLIPFISKPNIPWLFHCLFPWVLPACASLEAPLQWPSKVTRYISLKDVPPTLPTTLTNISQNQWLEDNMSFWNGVFLKHIVKLLVGVPCLVDYFFEEVYCTGVTPDLQIASVGLCCPCHVSPFKVSSPLAKRTIIVLKSQRLPTLPEKNNIASANGPSSEIHLPTVKATLPKAIFIPQQLSLLVPLRLATGCRVDLVSSN